MPNLKAIEIKAFVPAKDFELSKRFEHSRNPGGQTFDHRVTRDRTSKAPEVPHGCAVAQNGLADLRGRFCPRPFAVLVSGQPTKWNEATNLTEQVMGASYLCDCAAWLPFVAGNVVEADSPHAVWNSEAAQEIRRSVLDGDYSYCSRTMCPAIVNGALLRSEDVTVRACAASSKIARRSSRMDRSSSPSGHDSSCNLACPSCRVGIVMAHKT